MLRKPKFLIRRALVSLADSIAKKARQNASWSSTIPDAIEVGELVDDGNGNMSISVSVDMDKAPHARAFEKGSGVHGEEKAPYTIAPKNVDALAFFWEGGPSASELFATSRKFIGQADDGRLLFTSVEHPGVRSRPYLGPAVDDVGKSILSRIAGAFTEDLQEEFGAKIEIIR